MEKNNSYQFNVESKQITNISDWAYKEAGKCEGSNLVFENKLDFVHNGNIVDAKLKNLEANIQNDNNKEQNKSRLEETINEIKSKDEECGTLKHKIEQIDEEINELISGKINGSSIVPVFSTLKFSINLFFLIMLSAYLFLFYVSAIYKALYLNEDSIAENFATGLSSISVFPEPREINIALQDNLVVIFAPFVFYAFGYAMHLFMELKSKVKYLYITLVIAVTLALDTIIALLIHNNVNSAKELVGFEKEPWMTSSMFWVILLMGFVVYIIWSVLFDGLLKEWKKRDPLVALRKQKNQLSDKLMQLSTLVNNLKKQKESIENSLKPNQPRVITYSVSEMKTSLMLVKDGWIRYLVNIENSEDRQRECNQIFNNFLMAKSLN
jgi:hypothetical protein